MWRGRMRVGVLAVDDHRAARGPLQQRDELEHRALAGAGAAGEEHHLARFDPEADAGQRLAAVGIALADAVEDDHLRSDCAVDRERGGEGLRVELAEILRRLRRCR